LIVKGLFTFQRRMILGFIGILLCLAVFSCWPRQHRAAVVNIPNQDLKSLKHASFMYNQGRNRYL
jgi:hypothetical protein